MDTEGTMSGIKAHNEDDTEKLGEDLASGRKWDCWPTLSVYPTRSSIDQSILVSSLLKRYRSFT